MLQLCDAIPVRRLRPPALIVARLAGALLGCAVLAGTVHAQTDPTMPPVGMPPPGPSAPGAPPPSAPLYGPQQLEQLVAPIALYPDQLISTILMASTYPLEVVQADRWLQSPANASLTGEQLAQALQSQPWDASVKSLVPFPKILAWMDNALDWTEAVGDAFLAQQPDVMDAVQRLRARAQAAGTLAPSPQMAVTDSDQAIQIASTDPNVEYVPMYNPDVAYGPWPYPDYPPYAFYEPGVAFGTFIAFPIVIGFWGWDRPDWHRHRIDIDRGVGPGAGRGPAHPWRHDPVHRGGVPYRDPVTRARYEGGAGTRAVGSGYRGYSPGSVPSNRGAAPGGAPERSGRGAGGERPRTAPEAQRPAPPPRVEAQRPAPPLRVEPQRPVPQPRPQAQQTQPFNRAQVERPVPAPRPAEAPRPMPPAMQSFGAGREVHTQEMRGASSRASPPGGGGGAAHGAHR